MSELEAQYVKRGLWVNLEKGSVMGRTITTDIRTGTFLVAILAVLSSLATTHLWHLIIFLIHQCRANGRPSDALFRQQQATLRTLPAPSAMMADFFKLCLSWKTGRKADRALMRFLPYAAIALFFTIATIAAGIFSSYVVVTSNLEVLVSSPNCGIIGLQENAFDNYTAIMNSKAQSLAQECYDDDLPASDRCRAIFTKPRIPFTKERVSCPWASSVCAGNKTPAVSIDSGLLGMNDAFGLNLNPQSDVKFRKKTTCSVLSLAGRTSIVEAKDFDIGYRQPFIGEQFLLFHYGKKDLKSEWANATFAVSLATANSSQSYLLQEKASWKVPEYNDMVVDFIPLPELHYADADIALKMVSSNLIRYPSQVDDPLFSAHKRAWSWDQDSNNLTEYVADFPGQVVGCTLQYQFCFAKPRAQDQCTQLSHLPSYNSQDAFAGANSLQLAILQQLISSSFFFDLGVAEGVKAGSTVSTGFSSGLPDDQWIREIVGWESQAWASIQIAFSDYAIGTKGRYPFAESYTRPPATPGEKDLCNMQRMRKNGGFVNINVFGLAFIITFTCVVSALDITLLKFLVFVSRFRRMRKIGPRLERWIQDGVLQLQRRAYEAQGQGVWVDLDKDVPTTTERETLTDLPVDPLRTTFSKAPSYLSIEKLEKT